MEQLDRFDQRLRRASILLYAVGTALSLIVANVPGWNDGLNRAGVNALAVGGLLSLLLVWRFPWHRYNRNLIVLLGLSSIGLIATLVYFTGGVRSPFEGYFFLVVTFAALYYSWRIALALTLLVILANLAPLLYSEPLPHHELHYLVTTGVYLATVLVGSIMVSELVKRERARGRLEADLREVSELRDELARANELERRRVRGLLALQRTGASVYSHQERHAAIHAILEELVDSLGYQFVSVYEVAGDELVLLEQMGYETAIERIPKGSGVMWRVVLSGESTIVTDAGRDGGLLRAIPEIKSEVCVPLRLDGEPVGVINVETITETLDGTDLELLELFAQQASGALSNAHLHETQAQRERRAVAASRLLSGLNRNLDLDELLQAATRGPVEECDVACACVWLPDNKRNPGEWVLRASSGCAAPGTRMPALLRPVIDERAPVQLRDLRMADQPDEWGEALAGGLKALSAYPLLRGDVLLGVLGVFSFEPLSSEDQALFRDHATQLALSLDNVYAYDRERRRTEQLEAVHDIGREIARVLDPAVLYRELVRILTDRLSYGLVTVWVPDETRGGVVLVEQEGLGIDPETLILGSMRLPAGIGIVGHVAQTRRPYYTGDVRHDPYYVHLGHTHIRSELAVPIILGQELLAVLNVESETEHRFDDMDVTALEAVADQAAVALQNARSRALLSQQATTDSLTGLYNHRALVERLDEEVQRARRYGHHLSMLFFDVDRFKEVNDTHGHHSGDMVLHEIARIAGSSLRSVDTLARYGGEEFAAVLPQTDADEAARVAERLRQAVERHPFMLEDGRPISVTVSVGASTAKGEHASRRQLLRSADAALYRAKRRGRNRVCALRAEDSLNPDEADRLSALGLI